MKRHVLLIAVGLCCGVAFGAIGCGTAWGQEAAEKTSGKSAEALAQEVDALVQEGSFPRPKLVQVAEFSTGPRRWESPAFSADGKWLVTAHDDGKLRVWEVDTGKQVVELQPEYASAKGPVAISPDGSLVVFGNDATLVEVFDVATGKQIARHNDLSATPADVGFSPDGQWVYGVDVRRGALIAEARGEVKEVLEADLPDAAGTVRMTLWGPDFWVRLAGLREGFDIVWRMGKAEGKYQLKNYGPPFLAIGPDAYAIGYGMEFWFNWLGKTTVSRNLLPDWVAGMQFTRDGKYFYVAGGHAVDIRTNEFPKWGIRVPFPEKLEEQNSLQMAPDARRIVIHKRDGQGTVWEIQGEIQSQESAVNGAIRRLVREERFDAIQQLGELWAERTEMPLDRIDETLYSYLMMVVRSATERPRQGMSQTEYLEKLLVENPDNDLVRIALASHTLGAAYQARGTGYANTVSEEQWKEFYKLAAQAWESLEPIFEKDEVPPEAYATVVMIARSLQWEREEINPYLRKAVTEAPKYYRIWTEVGVSRMPRWGGDPRESQVAAARVADAIGGAEGDAVYARVAIHLKRYHGWPGVFGGLGFSPERVVQGALFLMEQRTSDQFANEALRIARLAGSRALARHILGRMEANQALPDERLWDYGDFQKAVAWAQEEDTEEEEAAEDEDAADEEETGS